MANTAHTERTLFGHPKGLFVLFLTEMWERFSFYGMKAILVLYISSSVNDQGLGWPKEEALTLYAWYTGFVYIMSIPGGIIADKILGAKKSVFIGGLFLCVGHWVMTIPNISAFYVALCLITFGVGMLKPNISIMVGELYKELDARRERGFFIFYIGINLGAFLATMAVGLVKEYYGWHAAFGIAGLGMIFGQLFYMFGQKWLKRVGNLKRHRRSSKEAIPDDENIAPHVLILAEIRQFFSDLMLNNFALLCGLIGISISGFMFVDKESSSLWAVMILLITLFLCYALIIQSKLNKIEKNRIRVLFVVFLAILLFSGGFEQTGGLLNLYTDNKIDRTIWGWTIPTGIFQGSGPLFIMFFAWIVATFWAVRRLKRKESSAIFKLSVGLIILSFGFLFMIGADYESSLMPFGKANMLWILGFYLVATIADLCIQPVALSFITRLAPRKFASIMMGVFFAISGLGHVLAGYIGKQAHPKEILVQLDEGHDEFHVIPQSTIANDSSFEFHANVYFDSDSAIVFRSYDNEGVDFSTIIRMDSLNANRISDFLFSHNGNEQNMFHATLRFEKDLDWINISGKNVVGDGTHYSAQVVIEEMESKYQYEVFIILLLLILGFGITILMFVKSLKKLTHGAEDIKEPKEIEDKMHGEIFE